MNKIGGMHIHTLSSEAYGAVRRLQPRLVTVMDPTAQWIRDLRAGSPGTYIVGRRYEDQKDFWQRVDPAEYARLCHAMVAPQLPDGWVAANEPFGHDDDHLFEAFDRWQAAFVVALRELGMEGVVNCFGTGNFTGYEDRIKITEAFPRTCQVARVHGPHDYDWPHMDRTVGGRCLRWVRWLEDLRAAGIEGAQMAVTECGLTQATYGGPDIGWQTLHDNLMIAADLYLDSLRWYNGELVKIPECIGAATYDWAGSAFGWPTFEHLIPYLVEGIADISAEVPEEDNMIKVYDFTHGVGDPIHYEGLDWLRSIFGNVVIHQPEGLQSGDPYWKIVWLDCTVGPTACIIHTDDEDGKPLEGILTVFYWSSAESLEDQGLALLPHGWTDRGAVGPTNANGDAGPSYGPGAYYDPAQGEEGPHSVWIYDPERPAQHIECLGMLTAHPDVEGNHLKFNIGYQRAIYEGGETPPPAPPAPPGEPGEILTRLGRIIEDAEWVRGRLAEVDALAEELADAL